MSAGPSSQVLDMARARAEELADEGAEAVVLTGSHARGDAHEDSDVDLRVVGHGPHKLLERRAGFLVSVSWLPAEEHRSAFDDPSKVGTIVPGWRHAAIVLDPRGVAAGLQEEAKRWEWSRVDEAAKSWIAQEMTEYAEEVHTLIGNLDMGQRSGAAGIRSELAADLAGFLAVYHHILYESENDLWELVADAQGERWRGLQDVALGVQSTTLEQSSKAALDLFTLAASTTRDLLDESQREVVDYACKLAARSL
jgi:hypothetical protein